MKELPVELRTEIEAFEKRYQNLTKINPDWKDVFMYGFLRGGELAGLAMIEYFQKGQQDAQQR